MSTTEIKIIIQTDTNNRPMSPSGPIMRSVYVNQKLVYMDKMTADMYGKDDPIRELELFLLGLKKRQSRHDGRTDSCYFVRFIQKIRRKLFAKNFNFKS